MRKVNENFWQHKLHFLIQSILIMIFMAAVLLPLGSLEVSVVTAIGASTLAASIFTMFGLPNSPVAAIHRVLGGYFIGIVMGILWHFIYLSISQHTHFSHTIVLDICGALAVGITVLIMALLDLIHPPTVGFTLALMIGPWNRWTICVVIVAVLILCLVKLALRDWFINLL